MIIFNGYEQAVLQEKSLKEQIELLKTQGTQLKIAAILFTEDAGSQLYTRLKAEAATRVGIEYQVHEYSLKTNVESLQEKLLQLNQDASVTGIIIQKPWRHTWLEAGGVKALPFSDDLHNLSQRQLFQTWWGSLTSHIDQRKDVDGLHPATLASIKAGTWQSEGKVLPATAQAILVILENALKQLGINEEDSLKVVVLGRSDIVGTPTAAALAHLYPHWNVELQGQKSIEALISTQEYWKAFDIVISATGQAGLIKGQYLKPGSIVIDVGEPRPDADRMSIDALQPHLQPRFLTPVPGGVGPMTVVSLLANAVALKKEKL